MQKFKNLNQASIHLARVLKEFSIKRETRGFNCYEFEEPFIFCIENPHDRYLTIPFRKNSKTLPFAESLALLSGRNLMEFYSGIVPSMLNYSDDGITQRAGYGPRIRKFAGVKGDYFVSDGLCFPKLNSETSTNDQLLYVVKCLENDINTRQAVISITDPAADQLDEKFNLIKTKDIPCCRLLQFMVVDGRLNLTSYFRSNDLIYGLQQVNVFNNCFMLEVVSALTGIPVGKYYHIANNLHFYDDKKELVEKLAEEKPQDYESNHGRWSYFEKGQKMDWTDFNYDLEILTKEFLEKFPLNDFSPERRFRDKTGFFKDWYFVLKRFFSEDKRGFKFQNPYLNDYFKTTKKSVKIKKYSPNAHIVNVLLEEGWKEYECWKPYAYMRKCTEMGRDCIYIGQADENGILIKK